MPLTLLPLARGFHCTWVAIIDWYSRKVLAWRVSNTMDTDFCIDALEEPYSAMGAPEIFNTDQGAQFTSEAFTMSQREHGITGLAWTAKAATMTTFSWNGSGAASNMSASTSLHSRMDST
ncbi:transposase [Marinobacter sp. Arc7-DN-1]|nr:transposase [Marinobacter sp. Arc7-DN-1]